MVKTAYRFALDPSPAQERALRSHAGAARFAWNWGLAKCKERYAAERKWSSAAELHKLWNAEKKADPALAWWGENSKCAYQEAFRNLERALADYVKSRKGQRKGKKLGFPRFKKKGKARDSFRFGSGVMRCSGSTVTLPRLGTIRAHEDTGKLASKLQDGSARRRKSAARLARIHAKAASVRADALHKATTALASRYETAVVEDLNVTGMISNRKLARAVSDQGFGTARRMLGYKTAREGGTLVVADRWYPSSKTCSACGRRKPSLSLAERTFHCDACGHTEDRDVNAARNLLKLAASGAERLNARGAAVRPGPAGHAALKREPGTPHGDKTGTAAPQGTAAA